MSCSKTGKFFPNQEDGRRSRGVEEHDPLCFAAAIAAALHRELDSTRAGIKTAAGWSGVNERTAKNWFSGRYGPNGEHLVALARNSNEVLSALLSMVGRADLVAAAKLAEAEQVVMELLSVIRSLKGSAE